MNLTEIGIFSLLHVATRGDTEKAARAITERLAVEVGDEAGRVATRSDGLLVLWFGPGRWLVHAPSGLAYGPNGNGPIPPNAALNFEVELMDVVPVQ